MAIINVVTYAGPFPVAGFYNRTAKTVDTLSASPNGSLISAKEFRYSTATNSTIDLATSVANVAARDAIASPQDGLEVRVATNGLTYVRNDAAWVIQGLSTTVANTAARTALTELVANQVVRQLDDNTTWRWNGAAWVQVVGGGETTRYDLTTVPTLTDLPIAGDQAVITSGDLAGMTFENVAGVIRYRGSSVAVRGTVFGSVAVRNAVAAAMLTNSLALGVGVPGPKLYYILTQDDPGNSATAGVYSLTAFDGPTGLQVQESAFAGTSGGGVGSVTPVAGWADPSVGSIDRNMDVGTMQELTNLVRTVIADLKTSGTFTS